MKAMPKRWHELLNQLWTKAVGTEGYEKAEWRELEAILTQAAQLNERTKERRAT